MEPPINVLGTPMMSCSHQPVTGWYRDGSCNTDATDFGSHTVCAQVTTQFLEYLRDAGNDLITPSPQNGFPGLVEGNQWCVCAASWRQAFKIGLACPVHLESTHARALEIVQLEELMALAIAPEA
jgi:uncharacterized protein (DUF2237 family)